MKNTCSILAAALLGCLPVFMISTFAQTPPAATALQVQMDAALDRFFTPLKALPFPACGSSSWSTAIDALR